MIRRKTNGEIPTLDGRRPKRRIRSTSGKIGIIGKIGINPSPHLRQRGKIRSLLTILLIIGNGIRIGKTRRQTRHGGRRNKIPSQLRGVKLWKRNVV